MYIYILYFLGCLCLKDSFNMRPNFRLLLLEFLTTFLIASPKISFNLTLLFFNFGLFLGGPKSCYNLVLGTGHWWLVQTGYYYYYYHYYYLFLFFLFFFLQFLESGGSGGKWIPHLIEVKTDFSLNKSLNVWYILVHKKKLFSFDNLKSLWNRLMVAKKAPKTRRGRPRW